MAIGVKVDEDLPQEVADIFTEYGYDAITVVRQGWQGLGDNDLWIRVQQEKRWLITADKGFADLRFYPPGYAFRSRTLPVGGRESPRIHTVDPSAITTIGF